MPNISSKIENKLLQESTSDLEMSLVDIWRYEDLHEVFQPYDRQKAIEWLTYSGLTTLRDDKDRIVKIRGRFKNVWLEHHISPYINVNVYDNNDNWIAWGYDNVWNKDLHAYRDLEEFLPRIEQYLNEPIKKPQRPSDFRTIGQEIVLHVSNGSKIYIFSYHSLVAIKFYPKIHEPTELHDKDEWEEENSFRRLSIEEADKDFMQEISKGAEILENINRSLIVESIDMEMALLPQGLLPSPSSLKSIQSKLQPYNREKAISFLLRDDSYNYMVMKGAVKTAIIDCFGAIMHVEVDGKNVSYYLDMPNLARANPTYNIRPKLMWLETYLNEPIKEPTRPNEFRVDDQELILKWTDINKNTTYTSFKYDYPSDEIIVSDYKITIPTELHDQDEWYKAELWFIQTADKLFNDLVKSGAQLTKSINEGISPLSHDNSISRAIRKHKTPRSRRHMHGSDRYRKSNPTRKVQAHMRRDSRHQPKPESEEVSKFIIDNNGKKVEVESIRNIDKNLLYESICALLSMSLAKWNKLENGVTDGTTILEHDGLTCENGNLLLNGKKLNLNFDWLYEVKEMIIKVLNEDNQSIDLLNGQVLKIGDWFEYRGWPLQLVKFRGRFAGDNAFYINDELLPDTSGVTWNGRPHNKHNPCSSIFRWPERISNQEVVEMHDKDEWEGNTHSFFGGIIHELDILDFVSNNEIHKINDIKDYSKKNNINWDTYGHKC